MINAVCSIYNSNYSSKLEGYVTVNCVYISLLCVSVFVGVVHLRRVAKSESGFLAKTVTCAFESRRASREIQKWLLAWQDSDFIQLYTCRNVLGFVFYIGWLLDLLFVGLRLHA